MCGIAGVVGVIDRPVAEAAVRMMSCALARRGPDAEGIESWDGAVLGHRRLAIYDLSEAGRQPMVSADRSVGVVFNGSIYNYRELREELIARGYPFGSHTDTEVLIHGYREWGLDRLISRLRGMFALALWDDHIGKLYLVRDRLGVKPLVFVIRNRAIMFASTIRALRVAGFVSDLDESAVADFLSFGFITDAHSIYRGAVKVPAASIIEWSDGTLNQREYWVPPIAATSPTPSFDEAVEETERLFLRSVEARLHADVPVGALLSGGIDSGLVCWAVAQLGGDVTAYTIGTPGDPWDEATAASATARIIGIKHHVLEMSEQDAPEMEELVSAYAEPFACASALGMLRVSRAVAPSAKVLLTGDGGDDVFLGYRRHRHLWLAEKLARRLPSSAKYAWLACRAAFPRIGPLRRAGALFDYATGGLGAFVGNGDGLSNYGVNGLLGDRFLPLPLDRHRISWSIDTGHRVLADFLDYERKTRFVGEYMTKVDGATMHYALEARSPFLDYVLWEFASLLPFDLRLHRGRLKAILRALARRRISHEVARRRKRGFGIPVQRWMIARWRPHVEAALSASILDKEGWIHSGIALSQLELAMRKGWAPRQLWYLFVLESWMRHEQRTV
jgi:asparagine synthase (glutamine-hydrolysing)